MALFTNKSQQQKKRSLTLAWEIGIVLIVKVILLWLLWYFFFSAPQAKHMQVPPGQVTQHFLTDNISQPVNPTIPPMSTQHD